MNKGDKKAFSCKFGELFVNGEKIQELKEGEFKLTLNHEEIKLAGDMSTYRKLTGYEVSGSFTVYKINSRFTKIMLDIIKNGYNPQITIQAMLSDKSFQGSEAVAFYDVTFDEITLSKIGEGVFEQEIPFKAARVEALEMME